MKNIFSKMQFLIEQMKELNEKVDRLVIGKKAIFSKIKSNI